MVSLQPSSVRKWGSEVSVAKLELGFSARSRNGAQRQHSVGGALKYVTYAPDVRSAVGIVAADLRRCLGRLVPPFDPVVAANQLGVWVVERDIHDDGYLTTVRCLKQMDDCLQVPEGGRLGARDDDDAVIVIKALLPHQRKRFITAHELAHFAIRARISRRFPKFAFRRDDAGEEFLCNLTAAEFLAPSGSLHEDLRDQGISASTLLFVRKKYDISLQSALVHTVSMRDGSIVIALHTVAPSGIKIEFVTPETKRDMLDSEPVWHLVRRAFETSEEISSETGDSRLSCTRLHESTRVLTVMEVAPSDWRYEIKRSGERHMGSRFLAAPAS